MCSANFQVDIEQTSEIRNFQSPPGGSFGVKAKLLRRAIFAVITLCSGLVNAADWSLYISCSGTAIDKENKSFKTSIEFAVDSASNVAKVERSTIFRENLDFSVEATPKSYFLSKSTLRDSTAITIDRISGKLTGRNIESIADTVRWQFIMQCEQKNLDELPKPRF
jgi:hypothetical protein